MKTRKIKQSTCGSTLSISDVCPTAIIEIPGVASIEFSWEGEWLICSGGPRHPLSELAKCHAILIAEVSVDHAMNLSFKENSDGEG